MFPLLPRIFFLLISLTAFMSPGIQVIQPQLFPYIQVIQQTNSAPVAQSEAYNLPAGWALYNLAPGVLINDLDPDQDTLTAVLLSPPAHGNFQLDQDGGFYYEPEPGFFGTDSFTYQAFDGAQASAPVIVTIVVDAWTTHMPIVIN